MGKEGGQGGRRVWGVGWGKKVVVGGGEGREGEGGMIGNTMQCGSNFDNETRQFVWGLHFCSNKGRVGSVST